MADVPECKISEEEVKIAVSNQLKGEKYEIVDFKIGAANETLMGFMGEHTRLFANVLVNGQPRKLQYFAKKQVTSNLSQRAYSIGVKAFYKEIEHYKTLFADMEDAISPERRAEMQWRPTCLYTRDHDLVVVEDLSPLGFYMLPERTLMPMEHIEATLRAVAKLHASNMIFEEKLHAGLAKTRSPNYAPGKGKQFIGDLYPNLTFETECSDISPDHPGHRFWQAAFKSQKAVIDLLPNYTAEQKTKIYEKFLEVAPIVFRWVEPSKKFRNVICHADLWGNNIMFLNGPDGKVQKAYLVDFQTTRYTPPALDLYQLLHIMQDTPFRNKYENQLKDFYYESLTKELAAEKLDVENVLPKKEWEESCVFYKRYAILGQFIFPQLNYTPAEMTAEFFANSEDFDRLMYVDRTELLTASIKADENCRNRSFEAMEEIIKAFNLV